MATNTIPQYKFPSAAMSPKLQMTFLAKQVVINDFENAAKVKSEKSKPDGSKTTLADNLLRNSVSKAIITLPLPNAFAETINHSWEKSTGLSADLINGALGKLLGGDAVTKGISQTASNIGVRAPVTDPGYFQRYGGTDVREFSFQWDFVIESKADANAVTAIILNFKQFSAPSQLLTLVSLLAPNYWIVNIGNPYLAESLMLQPLVIKSVAVNYAASSTMEVYSDGTPKYINLTISMAEISAITRETFGAAKTNTAAYKTAIAAQSATVASETATMTTPPTTTTTA